MTKYPPPPPPLCDEYDPRLWSCRLGKYPGIFLSSKHKPYMEQQKPHKRLTYSMVLNLHCAVHQQHLLHHEHFHQHWNNLIIEILNSAKFTNVEDMLQKSQLHWVNPRVAMTGEQHLWRTLVFRELVSGTWRGDIPTEVIQAFLEKNIHLL